MLRIIFGIIVITFATAGATLAVPACKNTFTYSFPFGDPPRAFCCTVTDFGQHAQLFERENGPDYPPERDTGIASDTHSRLFKQSSTCVSFSDMTPVQRIKAFSAAQAPGTSCRVIAGSYEQIVCSCETSCDPNSDGIDWTCNCPDNGFGLPPMAAPYDFPQDSYQSRPQLIGRIRTPCNSANTCEQFPPIGK